MVGGLEMPDWSHGLLVVFGAARWWIVGALVVTIAACGAAQVWWRRRAAEALQDRVSVDLVPATTFDPSMDEVEWFAGQLGRVPAAAGALPRRASAVRIRLTCEEGNLAYRVEGPGHAASVLRMSAYPEVEVVETGTDRTVPRIHFEGAPPLKKTGTGDVR